MYKHNHRLLDPLLADTNAARFAIAHETKDITGICVRSRIWVSKLG
jgi:hypothetical protein